MAAQASKAADSKPSSTQDQTDNVVPIHEQIAALAYRLWEDRGRPDGSPEADWLQAEQQLSGIKPQH